MQIVELARMASRWVVARLDLRSETGATAVEYGIMVGLIGALLIATVAVLGGQLKGGFCKVVTTLKAVSEGSCPS